MAGGLEAERVDVRRQIEIVVDRLGHVHDSDSPPGTLGELHR
jgi:sugar phosphate isomerase/epimerase